MGALCFAANKDKILQYDEESSHHQSDNKPSHTVNIPTNKNQLGIKYMQQLKTY